MSFRFDASKLAKGIAETELKTKAALGLFADSTANKMESYAKSNYPWTPRSGRAHQSLYTDWCWRGNNIRVELGHGVYYGIYLEFCNEKRYAIIQPTLDAISPEVMKGLQNLMR